MNEEDDVTYHTNTYAVNGQKFPTENASYPRTVGNSYVEDDDNDDDEDDDEDGDENGINNEEDEDDDDDDEGNGIQRIGKDDYEHGHEDDDDDEADDNGDLQRHPKKRKLKALLPSYEFAPRVPPPPPPSSAAPPSAPKPSYGGGRNPLTDWTEHETFILLDAWGDRFLKQGRKSLRSEEWQEVAEKVSHYSKMERTDTQCRNRLDTLKKKYKKEKTKTGEKGGSLSEWVYFKKMDTLLSVVPQQSGLSCGVDSGEFVFMNPKVYLNRSNALDEMRDSPGNSGEEDESEGLPPKRAKHRESRGNAASFKMLADSFQKFSTIYEKIENSKRQQMVELEKMRMDFHRDLEMQKRQILERAQAEIAKIWQGDDEENTVSAENVSG